ncbi:MAG TPA: translocation/assembly module TamB domain-containing protein [Bacteroidales bacterium]|nr:translocation/assembly module TamB domain-containing protein [Bacteroidales bacterium]
MLKSIKKTVSIILIAIATLALPVLLLMLLLSLSPVQTYITKKVTQYLSSNTNSVISIGEVSFNFFNRISAREIMIADRNKDTLLYVPYFQASIHKIDLSGGRIKLGRAVASSPVFALITDSTGLLNLRWYLDFLSGGNGNRKKGDFSITINSGEIKNGTFRLEKMIRTPGKSGIDFNYMRISGINAGFSDFAVMGDSVALKIDRLSALERSGFRINSMSAAVSVTGRGIIFKDAVIRSDSSFIDAPMIGLIADTDSSFRNFEEQVRFDIRLNKSSINTSELDFFMPPGKLPLVTADLEGELTGPLAELRGRNMIIKAPGETSCSFSFSLSGLPDFKNTFIFFEINSLKTSAADLQKLRIPGGKSVVLPEMLNKTGPLTFTGSFTGFINDFVTYGRLYTPFGSLNSDLSLRPEGSGIFKIRGNIKGSNIDLGKISGNEKLLGASSFSADIDGTTDSFRSFAINLNGNVDSLNLNRYNYRNINLSGRFTDKMWDGSVRVSDQNIGLDLLGMFDFSKELPEFDFTLNLKKADLFRLNVDRKDTTSAASLLLTANFTGNTIDNLDGEIRLLNSSFRKYGKDLEVYDFQLKTSTSANTHSLNLNTDFFNAAITGNYNFATIGTDIRKVLAVLFPSKFEPVLVKNQKKSSNEFFISINTRKADDINKFLKTGFQIADNSQLTGYINPDSIISINFKAGYFGFKNNTLNNLVLEAQYRDSVFRASAGTSSLNILNLAELKGFNLDFSSGKNQFKTSLKWDDGKSERNSGTVNAEGGFPLSGPGVNGHRSSPLKLSVLPGEVYVRNNLWRINPSEIIADSNSIKINNFIVSNGNNYFSVEGVASEDKSDTLYLRLNGININALNNLYESRTSDDPEKIHLALGGKLGGTISVTDIYRNFMFETDIRIEDFALLESNYGVVRISTLWNKLQKNAEIEINNDYQGKRMFDIKGYYDPETKYIDLNANADKLPIEILNPLLKMFASGIGGFASGKVRFFGQLNEPYLTGSLYADKGTIKIDYLQTRYSFSDSIRFDREGIKFRNIVFSDERGNQGTINGTVYHKSFREYSVDLDIRPNNSMVLNTRPKDNELFYGTAFASGVATIKTNGPVLRFDISAKTGRNTRFFIPLNTGMSVSENSFITFFNPEKEEGAAAVNEQAVNIPVSQSKSSMELVFDLEVTPDAEVQLLMDPKAGDIIKGSGSGNLNISLDRRGAFKIFGNYTIENGDYLFTLGNIINKSFTVENGGKITFNGDVDNADIDIKAVYKTKASLYEIMPGMLPDSRLRERIPVECQLILTGKLFNPVVGFDIYLPTADEETRAYLRSMIKSEEEMSRQFLFLLVMNSFYSDPTAGSQPNTAGLGSATVGVTTMEMLSNQLSNWLSQISKDFDIGINYRPGSSALPNSQELQVALSTQLLNDKVTINGNFDVAGNQSPGNLNTSSTSSFTGAFNIEYSISEKLKFRFFNRSNDNIYIDKGVQYTQGIGIFFRQDFNRLKDLFIPREKKPAKKEEEVRVVNK